MKKINAKIKPFLNYTIKVKKKWKTIIEFISYMVLSVFVWFGFHGFCIKKITKIVVQGNNWIELLNLDHRCLMTGPSPLHPHPLQVGVVYNKSLIFNWISNICYGTFCVYDLKGIFH